MSDVELCLLRRSYEKKVIAISCNLELWNYGIEDRWIDGNLQMSGAFGGRQHHENLLLSLVIAVQLLHIFRL